MRLYTSGVFYLIESTHPGGVLHPIRQGELSFMSPLLDQEIQDQVRGIFAKQLKEPVQMLFFSQKEDCPYCEDTQSLLQELSSLSEHIEMGIHDLTDDAELARYYNVDKAPGIVIAAKDGDQVVDYGIRYAGIPAGHEFSSLIQDLILVSGRDSGLSQNTRDLLTKLTKPVTLQVFVTPT
jgi:glutaredoxin-like protein